MNEQKHDDACGASRSDAGLGDTKYLDCEWTPDTPDAYPFCAGTLCNKCGAGGCGFTGHCEHDSLERHEIMVPNGLLGTDWSEEWKLYLE